MDTSLDSVDAVARSAYLWIRHLCLCETLPADERRALTGGLVDGLGELMKLDARAQELVAYAITLRDQEDAEALTMARQMMARPDGARLWAAFQRGRQEAYGIMQMLGSRRD
jgi:hypothetical protein